MDNIKFFSVLNSGDDDFVPFYDNFIEHLKPFGLDKHHHLIRIKSESGMYNSQNFRKISFAKLNHTRKFLKQGYTVVLSDLDLVFLRNPIPYLLTALEKHDLVIQSSRGQWNPRNKGCGPRKMNPNPHRRRAPQKMLHPHVNTGFFAVKPTPLTIDFFDASEKIPRRSSHRNDQVYIHSKLLTKGDKYKNMNPLILDCRLFPNAKFWIDHHHLVGGDQWRANPYIVHYHYHTRHHRTNQDKINSMKRFGHWKNK